MSSKPQIRVGISGWNYKPWRKVFYPAKLIQKKELQFASRQINTLEVNGTFYSLKKPADFLKWKSQVPADFLFSVKAPRFITHVRRLRDVEVPLANFFGNGILELKSQLGPILWQFPATFKFNADTFERFFKLLPSDTSKALKLARGHDAKIKGRVSLPSGPGRKLQHAIEVRHESFNDPVFFSLLKKYHLTLVNSDGAGQWPQFEQVTGDFVYIRLHGGSKLYESGYDDAALKAWAKKILRWNKSRNVFLYFDNDIKVRAPFDAMALLQMIGTFEPEYYRDHPVQRSAITGDTKTVERGLLKQKKRSLSNGVEPTKHR